MYKLAAQIPDGTVLGARGPFGPYAPDTALNKWFVSRSSRTATTCRRTTPSYQMAQAIMGVKRGMGEGAGGQGRQASDATSRWQRQWRT